MKFIKNFKELYEDTICKYGEPVNVYQLGYYPIIIVEYDDFKIRLIVS